MMQENQIPASAAKPRRSALRRQRLAVFIVLGVVLLLVAALIVAYQIANRYVVEYPNGERVTDSDGTKYYAVKKDGFWVIQNEHGELCGKTSQGLYETKDGTLISVDEESGEVTIVAAVLVNGTEQSFFDSATGKFDFLLYPMLEREDIEFIEVHNENDAFRFVRGSDGNFIIEGHADTPYDSVMFSTLVVVTGYTNAERRLDIAKAYEKNDDGSWKYEDYQGFRDRGYAEYGLPENTADAENYFIIKALDGTEHKVVIGDIIMDDTGYYARYADRDEVYVLKQMEESDYNATLSATLLGKIEDYVSPTVTTTLTSNNYFDVTDFTIWATNGSSTLTDFSTFTERVKFSFEPLELRKGTYYANTPYMGQGNLNGYAVNDYHADQALLCLLEMQLARTVKLYDDDGETMENLKDFVKTYGVAYAVEFTFNGSRKGAEGNYEPVRADRIEHEIWISPVMKNEDGVDVYYLFTEIFDMTVEVEKNYLIFLQWNEYDWVKPNVFDGDILYLDRIELETKNPTSVGELGVTKAAFDLIYTKSTVEGGDPILKVLASYNGMQSVQLDNSNLRFNYFYQTLLTSTLADIMPAGSAVAGGLQDQLKATVPDLKVTLTFTVNGEQKSTTYCFYFGEGQTEVMNGRGAYMTLNGIGHSYMLKYRVEKIVNDLGRVLSSDPSIVIDPNAKT